MVLVNKLAVSKTALKGDYRSSYFCLDDHRWYSLSETMRIQEITSYGTAGQHMLPEGKGTGLIWRMNSITRFEERDGGVYVELEALVLSRDIPAPLRLVVDPIVRRVSREAMETSLLQTQKAVRSAPKLGNCDTPEERRVERTTCAISASGASPDRPSR